MDGVTWRIVSPLAVLLQWNENRPITLVSDENSVVIVDGPIWIK